MYNDHRGSQNAPTRNTKFVQLAHILYALPTITLLPVLEHPNTNGHLVPNEKGIGLLQDVHKCLHIAELKSEYQILKVAYHIILLS